MPLARMFKRSTAIGRGVPCGVVIFSNHTIFRFIPSSVLHVKEMGTMPHDPFSLPVILIGYTNHMALLPPCC